MTVSPSHSSRSRQTALWCALAGVVAAAVGTLWALFPDWFATRLYVPYPEEILVQYESTLSILPRLLFIAAAVFLALAVTLRRSSHHLSTDRPFPTLSLHGEILLFAALLCVGAALSYRYWLIWDKPALDHYWLFGEVIHQELTGNAIHKGQRLEYPQVLPALREFVRDYPHSPSPLTPLVVSLGMFVIDYAVAVLMLLNLFVTAASLWIFRLIALRLEPNAVFWPLGVLFLTHAAVVRNSFGIQLDAVNGFFVLLFSYLWIRWFEGQSNLRLAALTICIVLAVFQKTTLFPLMAIPTLMLLTQAAMERRFDLRRTIAVAGWTAGVPLVLFALYIFAMDLHGNFRTQMELMGTGWNELDYSVQRFVYSSLLFLAPYLPLVALNRRILRPSYQVLLLYIVLFVASLVVMKGPFWARYYSHLIGGWLLLAQPELTRAQAISAYRPAVYVYVLGVAVFQYAIVYWNLLH